MVVESPAQRLERLSRPGDLVMSFPGDKGRDGEPPRSISFVGIDFKPLHYGELAGARLHLPVTVPLDWANARALDTDIPGVDIDGFARGNATLRSVYSSKTVRPCWKWIAPLTFNLVVASGLRE